MVVYKFSKSRKWVQVANDGRWRSVPFGHVAINLLNSMRSGIDFDTFQKLYANQISPFMMSGYSTEYGKRAVEEIKSTLNDKNKMKENYEILRGAYECVNNGDYRYIDYLYETLPIIHKHRKTAKKDLQIIYNATYDLAFRFNAKLSIEERKETEVSNYEKLVYDCIHYAGIEVCNDEYTGGKEEIAEKYRIDGYDHSENDLGDEWLMFPLDYAELLFNQDVNFIVKVCAHCGALFPTSYPQILYCDCCRSNDVPNTIRKNNKCRNLHKNIMDLINNSATPKTISRYAGMIAPDNTPTYHFRTESNFYWALCQGKKPKTEQKSFYENITNEEQYYEWLKNIHEEIKK